MKITLLIFLGFILGFSTLFIWALFQSTEIKIDDKEIKKYSLKRLPFDGKWYVFWGGDKKSDNAHMGFGSQHCAVDFVQVGEDGKTHKNDGASNSDYYCWGKEIKSVFTGTVVISVDGVPDCIPSKMNAAMVYGNVVMIEHNNVISVYAHLQNGSVKVKKGDKVSADTVIGLCGNSGNSSEPHLHFHLQSEIGFDQGLPIKAIYDKIIIDGSEIKDSQVYKGNIVSIN